VSALYIQVARTFCFAEFVYQREERSRIGRRKQGLHASLPSFRSTLWADEEPNRFCRSGSPERLTCRSH
jgi:hypothetical protein